MEQDQIIARQPPWEGISRQSSLWLLLLGILFLVVGILVGEPRSIFDKATQVCLQCIGIG